MTRRQTNRRPVALTLAGLVLAWAGAAALAQTAPAAPPPAAPAVEPSLRPEVAVALQAAQQAIADKRFDDAQLALQQAEAVAGVGAYESYLIGRLRIVVRAGLRDAAGLLRAVEATLATGLADPALRLELMNQAANAAYGMKDYAATVRWSRDYRAAGGDDVNALLRLAQSHYLLGQHGDAAAVLDAVAQRQQQGGTAPTEAQLRLQAGNAAKLGDDAAYGRVLEQLAASHPTPAYWAELLTRLARRPGFDARLRTDLLRLGLARQAWTDGAVHAELAERALAAGYPAEAVRALEAAQAAGLMGEGSVAAERQALLQRARAQAQADRADASATGAGASDAGRSARALFASGYAAFTAGRTADGLALMEQGLHQGLPQRGDDARLQLGAAHAMAGDLARARQWLAPIAGQGHTDGLSDLARLWLLQPAR